MARTLADKVDWLFEHVRNPETGQVYTHARIAEKVEWLSPGFSVSPTTIWNIRTGKSENPSWKLIEGLAKAFGVSPLYFSDDYATERTQEELALLAALRDTSVRHLALRAQGLTAASLGPVLDLLDRVRELEGLDAKRGRPAGGTEQTAPDVPNNE